MNNQNKFNELREMYQDFIYDKYEYNYDNNYLNIKYYFEIINLTKFNPEIKIKIDEIKEYVDKKYLEYLIFQIGLIELISYIKCTCSKNIIIRAGYINKKQIEFLNKLLINGLGEFFYTNKIKVDKDNLFNIVCEKEEEKLPTNNYIGKGNIICVGGGKDSCVSLEILKNEENNSCLIINPKLPTISCAKVAGYNEDNTIIVERILDKKIIELNNKGYLNGHTPFSAVVAFISYLCAYLYGKKNIILSNESSSNESTVHGTNINHQYSKTYEFENDFNNYTKEYNLDIKYFSLLRGLSEFQIANLFSHYKKYHKVFKSCNLGSKEKEWNWCCCCAKCLFIYIILSPFLEKEELIDIFKEDLFEREDLKDLFIEILGYSENKPFECVGTYEEARYAVSLTISKSKNLPYLLKYYKDNYELELDGEEIKKYNEKNNIDEYYNNLVKKEVNKYV